MTRKRALLLFGLFMVLIAIATTNAYLAGYDVGWYQGYDEASVAEALEWRKVPKQCGNAGTQPAVRLVARR